MWTIATAIIIAFFAFIIGGLIIIGVTHFVKTYSDEIAVGFSLFGFIAAIWLLYESCDNWLNLHAIAILASPLILFAIALAVIHVINVAVGWIHQLRAQ